MSTNLSFSDNAIKIKSSAVFQKIIVSLGLLFIGLSAYLLLYSGIKLLYLFSTGMILTAIGALLLINSKYYKIVINEKPGFIDIIETSFKKGITAVQIPLNYYKSVFIQKSLTSSGENSSVTYEVHLISTAGTSLQLASCSDGAKAAKAAAEIQNRLKIDLITEASAFKGMTNSNINFHIENPPKSSIKKENINNETRLSWKSGYGFLDFLSLILLLSGFFHLIYYTVPIITPDTKILSIALVIFYIISFIVLFFFAAAVIRKNNLVLNQNAISFHTSYLTKKFKAGTINRSDIGMIKNSINSGDDAIAVFTKTGIETIRELSDSVEKKGLTLDLVSRIFSLKDEMIIINISSLTVKEKFFLETALYYGL